MPPPESPTGTLVVVDTIEAEVVDPTLTLNDGDYSDPGIDLDTASTKELAVYADNRATAVGHYGWASVEAAIQCGRAINAFLDRPSTLEDNTEWLHLTRSVSDRSKSDYRRLAHNADALREAKPTSIRKALDVLKELNPRKSPTKAVAAGAAKPSGPLPDSVIAEDRALSGGPDTEDRVAELEQQLADQKAKHHREKVELVRRTRDKTAAVYMPESERDRLRAEAIAGSDATAASVLANFAAMKVPEMVDQLGDVTEDLIALRRDGYADASAMAKLEPALAELMDEVNVTRGTTPDPDLTPISARRPTGEELSRRDTRLADEKATKRIAELAAEVDGLEEAKGFGDLSGAPLLIAVLRQGAAIADSIESQDTIDARDWEELGDASSEFNTAAMGAARRVQGQPSKRGPGKPNGANRAYAKKKAAENTQGKVTK